MGDEAIPAFDELEIEARRAVRLQKCPFSDFMTQEGRQAVQDVVGDTGTSAMRWTLRECRRWWRKMSGLEIRLLLYRA